MGNVSSMIADAGEELMNRPSVSKSLGGALSSGLDNSDSVKRITTSAEKISTGVNVTGAAMVVVVVFNLFMLFKKDGKKNTPTAPEKKIDPEKVDGQKVDGEKVDGFPTHGELPVNEEPTFSSSGIKIKESGSGQSPSSTTADVDTGVGSVKASDGDQIKDDRKTIKQEGESRADGSLRLKKPKPLDEEGLSMAKLSGYNPKRNEFDPEYNADAEKLIADMEFKDTDTEADHQLKLEMLHIYNQCLDERERRKKFVLERDLLFPDSLVMDLSPEARVLYDRYKIFMRYHSKEDHEEMMKTVVETDEI